MRLAPVDSVVFAGKDVRNSLPCTVTAFQPFLGFDLRFHADYEVAAPMKELAGEGDELTIVLRVESAGANGDPAYFSESLAVPKIGKDAGGVVRFERGFDIGEGSYHVRLVMRDRRERVCAFRWEAAAALRYGDRNMKLTIGPGQAEAFDGHLFRAEPPVARINSAEPLRIRILVNFAPREGNAAALGVPDLIGLTSILRNISHEPRIAKFSLVAFSTNEQRIFYRQEDADQIDFPALDSAVASLKPGVIEYRKLIDRHSTARFLCRLIEEELNNNSPDAVVFVGPKVMLEEEVTIHNPADAAWPPVFYLNLNLIPATIPWRDAIGKVVKRLGGVEYTVSCPHDLWSSWSDIVERIVNLKVASTSHVRPRAEDEDAVRKILLR